MITLGIITVGFTSYLTGFALFFILLHLGALFSLFAFDINPLRLWIFASLFFIVLLLSFVGAYKNRWGLSYGDEKLGFTQAVGGNVLKGLVVLACEFLFSGPRLLFTGYNTFCKVLRLWSLNAFEVASILLWLLKKGTKATALEIVSAFPHLNVIRTLPQMRDLRGVVWLPGANGVVLLLDEFRNELRAASEQQEGIVEEQINPARISENISGRMPVVSEESLKWYATLGLPPFAPLQVVKMKYRQLAKIHHPDGKAVHKVNEKEEGGEQMRQMNEAYHNILEYSKDNDKM
jgi:hypothetical protein